MALYEHEVTLNVVVSGITILTLFCELAAAAHNEHTPTSPPGDQDDFAFKCGLNLIPISSIR